jgi:isopentenyl-diphosphate delta-isomerase
MIGSTENRKREHIETVLAENVAAKGVTSGFDRYFFEHVALPEIDLDAIDLSSELFGKRLEAPFLISSMTGGTARAGDINQRLAEAARDSGIAMAVGSQRAGLESDELAESYQVRAAAPDILLFANIGAVQLNYGFGVDQARRAVDMIEADALFLHLNSLQEAVQPEGDRNWRGLYDKIEALVREISIPVAVKEVGNGISAAVARRLADCGVAAIDVAGAGGTSWSEVEAHRQPDALARDVAHNFAGWGIPTALALTETRRAAPDLPIFASGGVRDGVDAAKAIRLGASLVGVAQPMLGPAADPEATVSSRLNALVTGLKIAAFCTGSKDLAALRNAVLRRSDDWSVMG